MSAWQRFRTFPKAAQTWCWVLAAASVYLIANIIYLNTESPYSYTSTDGTSVTGLRASQMNAICQSPAGRVMQLVNSTSATTCNNAQGIEQQKEVSAWLLVLAILALITLFLVFWNKTRPAGRGWPAPQGGTPLPGGTVPHGGTTQPGQADPQAGTPRTTAQVPGPPPRSAGRSG